MTTKTTNQDNLAEQTIDGQAESLTDWVFKWLLAGIFLPIGLAIGLMVVQVLHSVASQFWPS